MKVGDMVIDGPGFCGKVMAFLIILEGLVPVCLALLCGWSVEIRLKEKQ